MRTLLFLLCGFLLAGACRLLSKLFSAVYPPAAVTFALFFSLLWLGVAVANMIFGITRAGYSLAEELPIFLLILFPPLLLIWWLTGK
ncbi:hypothetical protein ACI2JR_02960 [Klebsiella sp. NPDC088457]